MRLLIAGGAGYVGSVLIPRLIERGYKVDVVDLFWFGNHLPRQAGILNKDIFHLTVEDLEPYDQVIFLAGLSNDPMERPDGRHRMASSRCRRFGKRPKCTHARAVAGLA